MADDWSYSGEKGPSNWASFFADANGARQSPINIETDKVKSCDTPEFNFIGFEDDDVVDGSTMTLSNDGHSVKVSVTGEHYVTGGGLPGKFKVEQFHFHWGSDGSPGSEHAINDTRYDAEVGDKTNPGYESLTTEFRNVQRKGQTFQLEKALVLRSLLPENVRHFYRYDGSLTTPPCTECVIWTVFDRPVQISVTQLERFRSLVATAVSEDEEGVNVESNYRPLQALGDRAVTASFSPVTANDDKKAPGKTCAIL
ncbi:carbonic anhydrase 14-like isoform X2 [Ptychodera flava]|uniref:carbonic anhydrase 14-like isoform X2 n=1 Tax=Ptychodera flava TaxID=63121 RepID=UPI003969D7CC